MIRVFLFLTLALLFLKVGAVIFTSFSFFGDEAQYWLWSKTLDFGYLSKPPLLAWIMAIHSFIFGDFFASLKTIPIYFYVLTSLAVYKLCRKLEMSKEASTLCALSFLIMPGVSLSSFLISTDVILLLFWTLSLYFLLEIKKRPTNTNFIILGILLGLAFLAKYAAIYFFVCFFTLIAFDKNLRNLFFKKNISFILSLVVFVLTISPNIIWNYNNEWVTLSHTSSNANLKNTNLNIGGAGLFLATQVLMIGPFLFLGFLINIKKISFDKNNLFLLCFSLPVVFIVLIESVLVRANANWAAVALVSLLVFFVRFLLNFKEVFIRLNFYLNFLIGALLFFLIASSADLRFFDRIAGIDKFSNHLLEDLNKTQILVVSDRLLYSNLAYLYRNKNISLYMPIAPDQKITKHFQISSPLDKNINKSFLYIGPLPEISYLNNKRKTKVVKELAPKFLSSSIKVYEISF